MNFNKSKIQGSKNAILSMTLILLLATTLMMAFTQPASGQAGVAGVSTGEKTTGYASVAPTLIGLGQAPTVNLWVFPLPTTYNYSSYFNGFYGVTVTFVRPDGTKDTFMPTDDTGVYAAGQMQSLGALFFTHYVPNMVGNWSVSFTLPAQNITWFDGTVQFLGCTSNTAYFTVQADTVLAGLLNGYPWAQLPNSNVYWSYPINDNNREWYQISGDWTGIYNTMATVNSPTQLRWQPYGSGPNTAHIVWNIQNKEGGIIGGSYGSLSYVGQSGGILAATMYDVVIDGMVYVNRLNSVPYGSPFGQFECINEATGQVMYIANGTISNGIHMPGNALSQDTTAVAYNQSAVVLASSFGSYQQPYLFGTVTTNGITYWNYYDPLTGALLLQIPNAATARLVDGTFLAYGAANSAIVGGAYVYCWNMSLVSTSLTQVSTSSATAKNWNTGIQWKVPLPTTLTGGYASLFAVSSDLSTLVVGTKNQYWGYNAATGAKLWNLTVNYAINSNEEFQLAQVNDFIIFDPVAATFHCYSMATGTELWQTPSFASSPWATTWTIYYSETNDLNNMYIAFPDGSMRAYSLTDGHLIWTSTPIPSTEYTENVLPLVMPGVVMVDGKLYEYTGYSLNYEIDPVPRLAETLCINATTGDTIWTLNGGFWPNAAANGYVIGLSIYDGQLYCLGKGPTSTTVTAQQQVGGSVLVQGSVLDKSPASSSATLSAMFANGVPAISDANMSVWMDYLHMQNSTLLNTPPACNGVPISLDALDPNGNYIHIGDTTSDGSGVFGYQWTPTTAGLYAVYATFSGSESYFSSYGDTRATVATVASTTTPAPTATHAPSNLATTSDLMTYIVAVGIAIIIAIAIATVLLMRKK